MRIPDEELRFFLNSKKKGYVKAKDASGRNIKVARRGYTEVASVRGSRFVKNK